MQEHEAAINTKIVDVDSEACAAAIKATDIESPTREYQVDYGGQNRDDLLNIAADGSCEIFETSIEKDMLEDEIDKVKPKASPGVAKFMETGTAIAFKFHSLIAWGALSLAVFVLVDKYVNKDSAQVLALVTFAIFGWAVQPANAAIEYTSFAFLTLVSGSGVLTWSEAWSGIASEGVWFIFCGMSMGIGLTETQITHRLASLLCRGNPSWCSFLIRLHFIAMLLAATVPSQVVRVQLALPIARSIMVHKSITPHSLCATGVILSLVIPTNHCGLGVLTGAVPNLVAIDALSSCGIDITWGFWFVRMAPTFFLGSSALSLAIIWFATQSMAGEFAAKQVVISHGHVDAVKAAKSTGSAQEHAVMAIFIGALIMWATDTIHRLRPVYIALGAVLLMYFPSVGPVSFNTLRGKLNFGVLIFVAATICLAPVLRKAPSVADTMQKLAKGSVTAVDGHFSRYLMLFLLALPLDLLVNGATPQGILPSQFCKDGGLVDSDLDARLGMLTIAAVQNIVILPYQCAPLLIVATLADDVLSRHHLVSVLIANSLLQGLILLPLTLAYWSLIGWST